jgi:hypothetical protein
MKGRWFAGAAVAMALAAATLAFGVKSPRLVR